MSTLSSVSGRFVIKEHGRFVSALLNLKAQARGQATKFGLQEKDFEESRETLLGVIVSLREALDQEFPHRDLRPLVCRMKKDEKSMEDWRKDLDLVATQLQLKEPVTDEIFAALDDVLRILDAEFAYHLNRLRNPYR